MKNEKKEPVRLSKLMSEKGICSRREADHYISQGLVFVDGVRISELGTKVDPLARITLDSDALKSQKKLISLILNKPIGYVSSQPEKSYDPAIKLVTDQNHFGSNVQIHDSIFEGLAVAGRLDIDSQGLLLFTQDGRLAKKIIGENSQVEKEYLVRFSGPLSQEIIKQLCYGIKLDGVPLKKAIVEQINPDQLRFVLKEGKKRQIRRMCEAVGLKVLGLKRVRIGNIKLGPLPEGKWRFLTPEEVTQFK